MATLLAFPILGVLLVIQSAVVSRIQLLNGSADLVFLAVVAWSLQKQVSAPWHWGIIGGLMVSFVSALPLGVPLIGYSLAVLLAQLFRRRVWQVPILAMLVTTFLGTVVFHIVILFSLRIVGNPTPWIESFNTITLPTILLNILLSIPAYALLGDLAKWLYPDELKV